MAQSAAEQFSELLTSGICEDQGVSGQSMLDPDSQNKLIGTGCAGGTDQEMWLAGFSAQVVMLAHGA